MNLFIIIKQLLWVYFYLIIGWPITSIYVAHDNNPPIPKEPNIPKGIPNNPPRASLKYMYANAPGLGALLLLSASSNLSFHNS